MLKGLIISKEYRPMFNGSIACLENLLLELKNKYELTVISYNFEQSASESIESGIKVKRLSSSWDNVILHRKKSNVLHKIFYLPFYMASKKKGLYYEKAFSKNALSSIEENLDLKDYDFVIGMGAPFENIRVAYQISQKYDLPFYPLEFDLYTFNPNYSLLNDGKLEERLLEETQWFERARKVFITEEMEKKVLDSDLSKYTSKLVTINLPNFKPVLLTNKKDDKEINILYTGMFYNSIRNPQRMLEIFEQIFAKQKNIKLHILGHGCEELLESAEKKYPENIFIYGKQPREKVTEMVNKANILVNLSNNTRDQTPSKIFEYISTGKPILNFYCIDEDRCSQILKDYPLSYVIDQRAVDIHSISNLLEFINNNKDKLMNVEELFNNYQKYTPSYVANQISKALEAN